MFRGLDQRTQKFYNTIAKMVSRINSKLSTMKTEIYKTSSPRRYQPLLHKVLINYPVLKKIVKKTNFMKNITLGTVIAYEILAKKIKNDGFRRKLKNAMGDEKLKAPVVRTFVRINTLKATEEDLKGFLIKKTVIPNVFEVLNDSKDDIQIEDVESYDESAEYDSNNEEESVVEIQSNEESSQLENEEDKENEENDNEEDKKPKHKKIKDLFANNMFLEKIKIQNFSSCLPAFILNPEPNSIVIDAAASPGNKTTHLCSIMNNTGKIYAIERDEKRYKTLVEQLEKYGAENVEPIHTDFLKISPEKYKADYILLDPSCSGSGIHINFLKDQKRINKLKNFQSMMLNHSFKFEPKAVVYSTCSKYPEEGEEVVKEALEKNPNYELVQISDYTGQRGYEEYEFSDKVIRTSSDDETGTIGFFVALFKRKE